jgi:hypothetical protein
MARTLARCTTRPSRITGGALRHRPTAFRPRRGGAQGAAVLSVGLGLALALSAAGAEVAGPPPDLTPLGVPSRELLPPPDDARPRLADLALVFYDPQGALPRGFDRFATEVQSIFRGLGVEAAWRVGGTYGGSPIPEVPVILLSRDPDKRRGEVRVMGLVRRDQQPQRAVWLFMEGVRFALGFSPSGVVDYEGAVARALARVAAHEIVHAVAPDEPHASEGLMRHSLDKRFLLGKRATIDGRCATSFRARLSDEWRQLVVRAPSAATLPLLVP